MVWYQFQAVLTEDVDRLIEDYYTNVQITPAQQEALSGTLRHEFDRLMATKTDELNRLTTNRRIDTPHGDYADALTWAQDSNKTRTETI